MDVFSIYILLDSRKQGIFKYPLGEFNYEPFYVGLTKEKNETERIRRHFYDSYKNRDRAQKDLNPYKSGKIRHIKAETGNDPLFIIYKKGLTQDEARQLEKNLVSCIGRCQKGPLTNLTDGGEGTYGYTKTLEEKRKLALIKIGTHQSEETKNKISQSIRKKNALLEKHFNKGRKLSAEIRKKMSDSHKGKKPSAETREKQSQKLRNRTFSPETIIKMSLARRGRRLSASTIEKISIAHRGEKNPNYGKHRTEETKNKLSLANIGKHHSKETKKKISLAHIGRKKYPLGQII